MKMNIKHLAALLTLSMILTTSCASQKSGGESENSNVTTTDSVQSTIENTLTADLPTGNYNGETFTIFNNTMTYAICMMDSETQNGEIFNDSVYNRTRRVEEMLNVKIKLIEQDTWSGSTPTFVANSVLAGDDEIDACFISLMHYSQLVTQKIFTNLYDIDEINLSKPWWNDRSAQYYNFNGNMFLTHCDANPNYYDCLWTCFYNKDLAIDLKLSDMYDLVESGKWTVDKMHEYMMVATSDLNGDGSINDGDRYGLSTQTGSSYGFLHGCDERGIEVSNGEIAVSDLTDIMFDAITKVRSLFLNNGAYLINDISKINLFTSGKALFLVEVLGNVTKLRDMKSDFGIIPLPKYDEAQEEYVSYYGNSATALSIPLSATDISMSGVVMEVMNAVSYEMVRPVYFDVVLEGKNTRDEKSVAMLELMFSNNEPELSTIFKWGNYQDALNRVLVSDAAISSTLESNKEAATNAINVFINNISK